MFIWKCQKKNVLYTWNEAINYLDNLEVSTDDSDSEDSINFQSATLLNFQWMKITGHWQ